MAAEIVVVIPQGFDQENRQLDPLILREGDTWGDGRLVSLPHNCEAPTVARHAAILPIGAVWQCKDCDRKWEWVGGQWNPRPL